MEYWQRQVDELCLLKSIFDLNQFIQVRYSGYQCVLCGHNQLQIVQDQNILSPGHLDH